MPKKKPLPFPLPRRSIWISDLLTLEELFEELYMQHLIDRATYVRYLSLYQALKQLAEEALRQVGDRANFEGEPPADWPGEARPDADE